ncbi:hypothetical protein ACQEVM_17645 [Streptomyces sp. CA-243310]|uniref:hypothetical protein n=1 Tax=Streptomyces sp. CA-243310 TaxID=3240056 RepID=UPI003D8F9EBA
MTSGTHTRPRTSENVPRPDYVDELQAMTSDRVLPYDGSAVSAAFKSGVLERITRGAGTHPG